MLRALNRLLRAGGRIVYTTIYISPGLDERAKRRARRDGPRAVASRTDQQHLLCSAGFVEVDELDVTAQFIVTTRAWIDERDEHADELIALEGRDVFEERQRNHRRQLAVTEDGLLRRALLAAVRP